MAAVDVDVYADVEAGVVGAAYAVAERCGVCEKTEVLHAFAGTGVV